MLDIYDDSNDSVEFEWVVEISCWKDWQRLKKNMNLYLGDNWYA